ncbi:MAG: VTT domain-containing protein [Desulfurococcaceae archaeon]
MILELLGRYGYIGLLIIALVSNAIPYSTVPYLIFVAPLLSQLRGLSLVLSVLALTLGATLGKIIVYIIGRSLSKAKKMKAFISNVSDFVNKHKKSVFVMVFLVAALPLPDDVFIIPIGSSKYSLLYFTIALFFGKLIVTSLTAVYGVFVVYTLEGVIGLPPIVNIPLMILITVIVMLVIGKIDWIMVEKTYNEKGSMAALIYIIRSIIEIAILKPIVKFISLFHNKRSWR